MAEIQAEDVCRYYGGPDGVCALEHLQLAIQAGERVAVVGKSGSGKSTLLNLLAGLDSPSDGKLIVGGHALHNLTRDQMATYRLQIVGVIFQAFQLIPQRTALQNVELPLMLSGVAKTARRTRAAEWLDRVGLQHRLGHHPYEMSGGEQQRVAIARALVNQPRVILADEPTGNLDSTTADEIVELLGKLCDQTKATFMLVTHDDDVARCLCSRWLRMHDGKLTECQHDAHA